MRDPRSNKNNLGSPDLDHHPFEPKRVSSDELESRELVAAADDAVEDKPGGSAIHVGPCGVGAKPLARCCGADRQPP